MWADAREDGTAPNNWLSAFGGPAWAYQPARRQYYHHKFLRQQPKLNWHNDSARKAALDVLDLWLSRGADGYRLDVANAYLHDATLADNPPIPAAERTGYNWSHAPNMQRHLHDSNLAENVTALDTIRRVVERYPDRFVFGEFSEEFERSGAFLPPDKGLHAGYTFAFLIETRRDPAFVRRNFEMLARHPKHWPCMSFSNHDVIRTVTRFGGGPGGDPALAKLMLALLFSLKGTTLLYQGEELGLPEADLRRDQLRDPVGDLYYPVAKGRDGCRTPMPWDEGAANLGFSTGTPWLPLAQQHKPLSVSVQEADPASPLNFARRFLAARKTSAALKLGEMEFLDTDSPVLAFIRRHGDEAIVCVFNMGSRTVEENASLLGNAKPVDIGTGQASVNGGRPCSDPLPPLSDGSEAAKAASRASIGSSTQRWRLR